MKKFKFKDGSIITASCAEEAKAKHRVTAGKSDEEKMTESADRIEKALSKCKNIGTIDNDGNGGLEYETVGIGNLEVRILVFVENRKLKYEVRNVTQFSTYNDESIYEEVTFTNESKVIKYCTDVANAYIKFRATQKKLWDSLHKVLINKTK